MTYLEEFKYSGKVVKDSVNFDVGTFFGEGHVTDGNGITVSGTWLQSKEHGCSMFP